MVKNVLIVLVYVNVLAKAQGADHRQRINKTLSALLALFPS